MYSLHGILAKREKKYVGEGKNEEIDSPENILSPPCGKKNILEEEKFNKIKRTENIFR